MDSRTYGLSETAHKGCGGGAAGCIIGALIPTAVLLCLSPGEQAQGMILVVPMAMFGLAIGLAIGLAARDADPDDRDAARPGISKESDRQEFGDPPGAAGPS